MTRTAAYQALLNRTHPLRPPYSGPAYPPYHRGPYLEEYFFKFHSRHFEEFTRFDRQYLPVFWTSLYNSGRSRSELIRFLEVLDRGGKYFSVSQHDDAVCEVLPPNTLCFGAGGNQPSIPIPLICSGFNASRLKPAQKTIFASFVGSMTHEIRGRLMELLKDNPKYFLRGFPWNPKVPVRQQLLYLQASTRSKFILCPRGYGRSSFRLYEAFQLSAVPVYISDEFFLPFAEEIDWSQIAVLVKDTHLDQLDEILSGISDDAFLKLEAISKVYPAFFTMESMCRNILKRLRQEG